MKSDITPMISVTDAIWDCCPCDNLKTLAQERHVCGPKHISQKLRKQKRAVSFNQWNDHQGWHRVQAAAEYEKLIIFFLMGPAICQVCNHVVTQKQTLEHIPTFGTRSWPGTQGSQCAHSWQWYGNTSACFLTLGLGQFLGRLWFWKIIQRHSHP